MLDAFDKLAQEIKFKKDADFSEIKIIEAKLNTKDNIFNIKFQNEKILPFEKMLDFMNCLNNNFKYKSNFSFAIVSPLYEQENIIKYLNWIFMFLRCPNLVQVFTIASKKISREGKMKVLVNASSIVEKLLEIENDVMRIMHKFGFINFAWEIKLVEGGSKLLELASEDLQAKAKQAFAESENEDSKNVTHNYKIGSIPYQQLAIEDLDEQEQQKVEVQGMIFKNNFFVTKTGLHIFTFGITNKKDAVDVKVFANKSEHVEKFKKFQVGEWINVRGNLQIDNYSKARVIISNNFRLIDNPQTQRIDEEQEKRVELGLRTRMSTMDGVTSAIEYLDRAQKWGHQALAIVDTESVQSFPEFYKASKDLGIKPIYGVTLNVLERNHQAIYNGQKKLLSEDEYVVFDIETTGLSPHYNEIIEFGGAIIKNGQIIKRVQFFVKPEKLIPPEITRLTNITNDDVAQGENELEALLKIKEVFAQKTLVAHNASFDLNFINAKLAKHNLPIINNPVIDTLITARINLTKNKKFNLQSVAKAYEVEYDTSIAHRADYDADVLSKIWLKMISDLAILKIFNQEELAAYQNENVYAKAFAYEVSILAKNQKGLKKLFQLVSLATTKQLFRGATVFWDQLEDENLLIGSSALKSALVDKMLYGSHAELTKEIAKYDYIEIQPPQNFKHKINEYFTKEQLEDALTRAITESKKQNKLVVASGDVRYLDKEDKIYHEVYINAKGLGGKPHYLKKFNALRPIYPDQHLLTTAEMKKQFIFLENIALIQEIVVDNSQKIAKQIDDDIVIIRENLHTPVFADADQKLENLVYENAYKIYGNPLPEIVKKRLIKELVPIKKYRFSVIYWISHLLVKKSLSDGYLVGSRGSVGSSLVATLANITEVNPLDPHYLCSKCQFSEFVNDSNLNSGFDLEPKKCPNCNTNLQTNGQKIPFETFLGFDADKVPDIDLNFSGEYQPVIHQEVKNIFGETHCFRAGTISTVAEKTAFGFVKGWAEETKQNVSRNFIEFLAKKVAGTKRTTGQHPGGIIVVPKDMIIEDFSPVNYPANDRTSSWKTTHFDFHAIHDNLLKLDLLGHDDPTAIKYLEKLTKINAQQDISFQDQKVLQLFSSTEPLNIRPEDIDGEKTGAMGVPEFGTTFVRRMLKTAKVKSFGDLIAISGLSHGTDVWSGNAETIVKKHQKSLSELISCRDNIMTDLMAKGIKPLLCFQIMESVRKGKGLTAEWEKELVAHNVEAWYIESLKKIKYMFPKAHATAYVMMAWRIAWFKVYYPVAYYAAYFTTRADVFDLETVLGGKEKVLNCLRDFKARKNMRGEKALTNKEIALIPIFEMVLEAFARGIKINNLDLNTSEASTWIFDAQNKVLTPPLTALDGLGEAAALSVVEARKERKFLSIEDLQKRTALNKTVIELLKKINVLNHLSETNQIQFDLFSL